MSLPLPTSLTRFQKGLLLFAIAMALFTLGRLLLLLNYPNEFSSLGAGLTAEAFFSGLRFDGSVIGRLFAIPLVLMWLPFRLFDRRVWFDGFAWLLYALTLGCVLLLIGDVIYFAEVQRHVSYELLAMGNDTRFLFEYAFQAYLPQVIGFLALAVALGWLWLRILRIPFKPSSYAPAKFLVLFILLAAVGRGGFTGKVIEIIEAYEGGNAAYGNLVLNGAFTTLVFALNLDDDGGHQFFDDGKLKHILAGEVGQVDPEYPMVKRFSQDKPTGYNVVFVLMESWNFDFVDSFGNKGYGVTPNFDAMAKDGLRFTQFYAAGQRSIDGIQSTLTGIPVLKGLPRLDTGIGVSNISRLGKIARDNGYSTIFMQTSDRDSYKVDGIAAATGFEHYYGREDVPILLDYPDPDAAIFGWDYDTLQFMKKKIDGLKKPFLAYLFTGSTHRPYAVLPQQFMTHKPHDPQGINGYLDTLNYSDWSIGQFIQAAKKTDWFDNTIFIFTADHTTKFQKADELPDRFHTPFLIYAPGIIKPGEKRVIGSQLDVMPTIIDLLGFDNKFSALGQSLFRKKDGGEAFVTMGGQNIGLITKDGYIFHDLKERMASGGFSKVKADEEEQRLLAKDQLSYELLKKNKWAY